MMRKLFSGLFMLAGIAAFAAPAAAQAPLKIGYLDSRRIVSEAPGAKEAQATFEQDMVKYRGELKLLEDSLKAMLTEYEQKQVMLSPDAKKQREETIRAKQAAYQTRAGQLEEQAGRRQAELVQPIMDRVQKVIDEMRTQGGYALIFDKAGNALVTADPSLDLTEQVLTRLKAQAAAPAAPAPKKP
jgi:outer membrane protein